MLILAGFCVTYSRKPLPVQLRNLLICVPSTVTSTAEDSLCEWWCSVFIDMLINHLSLVRWFVTLFLVLLWLTKGGVDTWSANSHVLSYWSSVWSKNLFMEAAKKPPKWTAFCPCGQLVSTQERPDKLWWCLRSIVQAGSGQPMEFPGQQISRSVFVLHGGESPIPKKTLCFVFVLLIWCTELLGKAGLT